MSASISPMLIATKGGRLSMESCAYATGVFDSQCAACPEIGFLHLNLSERLPCSNSNPVAKQSWTCRLTLQAGEPFSRLISVLRSAVESDGLFERGPSRRLLSQHGETGGVIRSNALVVRAEVDSTPEIPLSSGEVSVAEQHNAERREA